MIKLGVKARDNVTGLTGIIIGRCEYLNGCTQYCIKPPLNKGTMMEGHWIDENQIKVLVKGINFEKKDTGGPMPDSPKC